MAHKKSGGSTKNLRDSQPKYLGVKLGAGAFARPGAVIVRQRGTQIVPGVNVRLGKDHTIFSIVNGKVSFTKGKKQGFDGKTRIITVANVRPA